MRRVSGLATALATTKLSTTTSSRTTTDSPAAPYAKVSACRCWRVTCAVTSVAIFRSTNRPRVMKDSIDGKSVDTDRLAMVLAGSAA